MTNIFNKGAILIISGPSGCGKSSLLKKLYQQIDNYYFSISTTTRQPRDGEKDGVDYYFVTKEEFEDGIKNNLFLEYAVVHNNYYGTSLNPINKALDEGKLIIFDIDVQGHKLVRDKLDNITTSVFITTPTLQELKNRLNSRNTDSKKAMDNRIKNAKLEINSINLYDYLIINDDLQQASEQLISIAITAKRKTKLFDIDTIKKVWF
jgi:guanylate kinase